MSVLTGDTHCTGTLTCVGFVPPANSITDAAVPAGAGVKYTKVEQRPRGIYRQPNTAAVAETVVAAVITGATGAVVNFKAGCIGPCVGADTITVDLKKNGASILTAAISLTNAQAAYAQVAAAIASAGLVAGDVLTVVVTPNHSTGTLGTGVFAVLDYREDPQ
jgi:hypothetical protein